MYLSTGIARGLVGKQQLYPLDQDVVETRFPDSILVSSANHFIDLVTDEFEAIQFSGIGYHGSERGFYRYQFLKNIVPTSRLVTGRRQ